MNRLHLFSFLLIILFSFYIYQLNSNNYSFNVQDETILKYYSDLYLTTGNFSYNNYLVDNGINEARPRGSQVINGKIVPLKFIGFIFLTGNIFRINPDLVFIFVPFVAIVGLMFIFLFTRNIFKNKLLAILSLSFLSFLPFYWYWSNHSFFENIISSTFLLIGIYYFISYLELKKITRSDQRLYLSVFFFGISIAVRYDSIIFIFAYTIPFILDLIKIPIKKLIVILFIFFITLFPILYISYDLYGSPFMYGAKIMGETYNINYEKNWNNVLDNLGYLFLSFPLIIFLILGILTIAIQDFDINIKKFYFGWIFYYLIFCYIYLSERYTTQLFLLHDSFVRYSLNWYVFSVPLIVIFIFGTKKNKLITFLIFTFIVISICYTAPFLKSQWDVREINQDKVEYTKKFISNDSVILVNIEDKYIFPHREVVTLSLINNSLELNYEQVCLLLKKVHKLNNSTYLYNSNYFNVAEFSKKCTEFKIKSVEESGALYKAD